MILRPSGSCSSFAPTSFWTAFVTDDVAVKSVVVTYVNSFGNAVTVPLSNVGGSEWNGSGPNARNGTNYTVVATDFADNVATFGFSKPGTCV